MRSSLWQVAQVARVAFLLSALGACSSSESTPGGASGSGAAPAGSMCSQEKRADTYVADLEKIGEKGVFKVRIASATPAPPDKGTNAFAVDVLDASGAPVSGADIEVVPLMPDHGHGSAVKPTVAPEAQEGRYSIGKVYLSMAGLWTLAFVVRSKDLTDTVTFAFCIDG
jgi:hypothetical protein